MNQIQKITPQRQQMLKIMYDNYFDRHSKPYTTQNELAKKLNIAIPSLLRHLKELEDHNLIKKMNLSEIEQKYKYKYDSRTQYLYYVDKPLHELQDRGSFIPTYFNEEQ